MTEDNANTQAKQPPPRPNPALKHLDKLVGTWEISGEAQGQVTYEWMDGGFFLVQRGDLEHLGQKMKVIGYLGYEQKWGSEPGQDCTSHVFDNAGHHFEHVWEVGDNTLTIWGGYVGSPAHFKGKFSDDGNTMTGRWEWLGGGYESTMTRVKSK